MFGIMADLINPYRGGSVICIIQDPGVFLLSLAKIRPDYINVPPKVAKVILESIEKYGPDVVSGKSIKKILCSSAPMSENIVCRFKKYGIDVYSAYGLTECSPCVSVDIDGMHKENSSGRIIDCNKVRICDNEVLVSGSNVMIGYYDDKELTDKKIHEGWLHTGDCGRIDTDGYLFITGRLDRIISLSNGKKISPEIYEKSIMNSLLVDTCFIKQLDNEVYIFLHGNNDLIKSAREMVDHCTNDASFWDVIVIIDDDLSKTSLGKTRRFDEDEAKRIIGNSPKIYRYQRRRRNFGFGF